MGQAANRKVNTAALESVLNCVMPPKIFRAIEALCVQALASSANHEQVRGAVAQLSFQIKMMAHVQFGSDTVDSQALTRLLERTDPNKPQSNINPPPPRRDPITDLENRRALDADQVSATLIIREVWSAFSRFQQISGRGWDNSGGAARTRVLQPLDVMGQETYDKWKNYWVPWTVASRARAIDRRRGLGKILPEKIIHDIVIEHKYPTEVDEMLALAPGMALRCLKQELKLFIDPEAISREEAKLAELSAGGERRGMPLENAA